MYLLRYNKFTGNAIDMYLPTWVSFPLWLSKRKFEWLQFCGYKKFDKPYATCINMKIWDKLLLASCYFVKTIYSRHFECRCRKKHSMTFQNCCWILSTTFFFYDLDNTFSSTIVKSLPRQSQNDVYFFIHQLLVWR